MKMCHTGSKLVLTGTSVLQPCATLNSDKAWEMLRFRILAGRLGQILPTGVKNAGSEGLLESTEHPKKFKMTLNHFISLAGADVGIPSRSHALG